jgi:hypothetical protein
MDPLGQSTQLGLFADVSLVQPTGGLAARSATSVLAILPAHRSVTEVISAGMGVG